MRKASRDYKEHLLESLRDPEEAAAYLNAALEEQDVASLLLALRDVAEARGISKVSAEAGLNRENVYRILSDQGNPRISSFLALFKALGLKLAAEPLEQCVAEECWEEQVSVAAAASSGSGMSIGYAGDSLANRLSFEEGVSEDADHQYELVAA